ncbi:MAG: hypothetical protein ACI8TP_002964 [Acidimicrobiales bacterium]|jgi:hypothetical protein
MSENELPDSGTTAVDETLALLGQDRPAATTSPSDKASGSGDDQTSGRRPLMAMGLFAVVLAAGGYMVSSLEKVPVPAPVEVVDEGPTDRERANVTRERLVDLGLTERFAYRSVTGVGVVDLADGEVRNTREFSAPSEPGNYVLLRADDANYVVDVADPSIIGISNIDGQIGTTADPERFVAVVVGWLTDVETIDDTRYAYTLGGSYGANPARVEHVDVEVIAADATTLIVDNLGVVVEGSGHSFVVGADGSSHYSDHPVLAASASARIEERCSATCEARYVGSTASFALPAAGHYRVSPDGAWVLLYNDELADPSSGGTSEQPKPAQLIEVATQKSRTVLKDSTGEPQWATDSSFVGWLDDSSHALRLSLVFTDDRSSVSLDLEALRAPDRDSLQLVFLGAP